MGEFRDYRALDLSSQELQQFVLLHKTFSTDYKHKNVIATIGATIIQIVNRAE